MIGPKLPAQTRADERRARAIVRERDGGACVRCGSTDPVNWDHRLNRSQGGRWDPVNGQLLCGSGTTGCHGWRTNHPKEAAAEGFCVPGGLDPATYPAQRLTLIYGRPRFIWCVYRPTLENGRGWVEITFREARRRIAEGRLYEEVPA